MNVRRASPTVKTGSVSNPMMQTARKSLVARYYLDMPNCKPHAFWRGVTDEGNTFGKF